MKRFLIAICLSGLAGLSSLWSQAEDPLLTPVPLVESEELGRERAENQRLWKEAAADNALRSGLASIAVGLYDELLADSDGEAAKTHRMELNRVSAFIALGQL